MGSRNGGISKLSMKKLGTPSGAGPGRAKEKVGLAAVGTPGPVMPAAPVLDLDFFCFFVAVSFCPVTFLTVEVTFFLIVLVLSFPRELFGLAKPGDEVLGVVVVEVAGD